MTTTPPIYLPDELVPNADQPEAYWYRRGRRDAAADIRRWADANPNYSDDNTGLQGLYDAEAIALSGLDPYRIHTQKLQPPEAGVPPIQSPAP
jgi:hypothetical protein